VPAKAVILLLSPDRPYLKDPITIPRKHLVVGMLFAVVCLFNVLCKFSGQDDPVSDPYGQVYAGSAACVSCHKNIYDSFIHSAHWLDSRPPSAQSIRGSFHPRRNRFSYRSSLSVVMERKDSGFYQTAYRDGRAYRTDIFGMVIGSGRKGQSYLYWRGEQLFQLPVSYFTPMDEWCNSPGYTTDSPFFDRRVPASCLECHTTNARTVFRGNRKYGDLFDKRQLVYGIDCEKCHGPGARHAAFHTEHPGETTGVYIINAGRLTRQQQLDACALCHSGSRLPLKPAFSFRVGDKLNDFSEAKYHEENSATLDVHGNQYGLLTASRCFAGSALTCSNCHNPHANEAGNLKMFSRRCMSCHDGALHKTCAMPSTPGLVLSNNCIDCHMPALPSQRIVLGLSHTADTERSISNMVRTHRIAVYAAASQAYLKTLKAAPH
jgi:Cytochrome c554 and c-prime